ncbi:hypothetical protein ACVWWN_003428 [Mycobacterium sp. URHB0021]
MVHSGLGIAHPAAHRVWIRSVPWRSTYDAGPIGADAWSPLSTRNFRARTKRAPAAPNHSVRMDVEPDSAGRLLGTLTLAGLTEVRDKRDAGA